MGRQENMKRMLQSAFTVVCTLLLLLHLPFTAHCDPDRPVDRLLPSPGFAEGWVMKEKVATYTEKDLYKYINGEAELYYPYGFKALATAVYARSDNPEAGLVADIYEMGSPMDAFGIYSRYRDPDEEPVAIGTEGFVNESQLLFAKNRYFVRLSPSGTVTMEKPLFLACAQAIARVIPDDSTPRMTVDILDIPEIVPKTVAYIVQGVLGYAFFRRGLTADARLDGNVIRIFLIIGDTPESSGHAFKEYQAFLEKAGVPFLVRNEGGSPVMTARDPIYKGLVLMNTGKYLIGAAKLSEPEKAIPIIRKIESRTTTM
jgi:hypothetical protein